MRGTRALFRDHLGVLRIIPADAGNTTTGYTICLTSKDHPRGCGKHRPNSIRVLGENGSSPRMRGTQGPRGPQGVQGRIIPADAGNTLWRLYLAQASRDHPRGCGEHVVFKGMDPRAAGSSPRMRGTQSHVFDTDRDVWIIPADAGNTNEMDLTLCRPEDHPRGCGEHFHTRCPDGCYQGSSPRMRGTHRRIVHPRPAAGIIPADAGNTCHRHTVHPWRGDHPRGCGEHLPAIASVLFVGGSSPRMRGTRSTIR